MELEFEGMGMDLCIRKIRVRVAAPQQNTPRAEPRILDGQAKFSRQCFANEGELFGTPTEPGERRLSPMLRDLPEAIPKYAQELARHINSMPLNRIGGEFPSRNTLKQDPKLRGEVSRKTGCLRVDWRGSKLRRWKGDKRLFSAKMWRYLTEEGYAFGDQARGLAVSERRGKKRKKNDEVDEMRKRMRLSGVDKQRPDQMNLVTERPCLGAT
ncbi:hypothetical protein LTR36_008818 [Oleoguttula mirabilis]|uniref:Uncharacterized protein n=1 Tax=Oleoguttula mirabilis TaxID=1507867 RepID=A0AAV9J7V9_9PEZI|nr:hypothetical protein LTR36_008818 [Oleoguttula mirabilis]